MMPLQISLFLYFYTILIQKSGIQLWKFSAVLNHSLLIMRLKMQKNMQKKMKEKLLAEFVIRIWMVMVAWMN